MFGGIKPAETNIRLRGCKPRDEFKCRRATFLLDLLLYHPV